jgi:hypothetical protein
MQVANGFFNSGGSPCVNFRLAGVLAGSAALTANLLTLG